MGETGILKVKGKINQNDMDVFVTNGKATLTNLDLSKAIGSDIVVGRSGFADGNLEVLRLGSAITSTGITAFYNNANLTEVDLSKCTNLTTIDYGSFMSCDITNLTLPENAQLTTIGESAFMENRNLQTISYPATITHIGSYMLANCKSLTTIVFKGTVPPTITSANTGNFIDCFGNKPDYLNNITIYLPNVSAETDAWKTFLGESNGWTIKYGESPAVNP